MSFAQEEILEIFQEAQGAYGNAAVKELIMTNKLHGASPGLGVPGGYQVFGEPRSSSSVFKSCERKMYNRAFTARSKHEQIKARILAGERPKTGGRGRPPTRWWRVADELGIDIGQLPPVLSLHTSRCSTDPPVPADGPSRSTE